MAEKDEGIAAQMGMTLEELADWRHVHTILVSLATTSSL